MTTKTFLRSAKCYLVLSLDNNALPTVSRMTKTTPALAAGEIAVAVKLTVPRDAFTHAFPTVEAEITPEHVAALAMEVAAVEELSKGETL